MRLVADEHKLTIDTPEQVALEFHIAGVGSRFMAFVVDSLLQSLLFLLLFLLATVLIPGVATLLDATWGIAILFLALFSLYWGYFAFFEASWKGQTPGKREVGIRVVKNTGRAINAYEAIARNLLRAIDSLPALYLVGIVTMLLNRQNRRLGDYVAGTLVVHEKLADDVDPVLQDLHPPAPTLLRTQALTLRDLELVESFLHRRLLLEPAVRGATAARIADHLRSKAGLAAAPGQHVEDFLQEVARAIRDHHN